MRQSTAHKIRSAEIPSNRSKEGVRFVDNEMLK